MKIEIPDNVIEVIKKQLKPDISIEEYIMEVLQYHLYDRQVSEYLPEDEEKLKNKLRSIGYL